MTNNNGPLGLGILPNLMSHTKKPLKPSSTDRGTQLELEALRRSGATELTPNQLKQRLNELGYKISAPDSFNYNNVGNQVHYKARSLYITEKDTDLSFANIHARRDHNFNLLQELRKTAFVYGNGRIWEI